MLLRRALPLLLVALTAVPAGAQPGRCGAEPDPEPISVEVPTLSVQIQAERARYRRGEAMVVRVRVHVGHPLGPAVDKAETTVVLHRSGRQVKGLKTLHATTRADGVATLRVRLPTSPPPGPLDAHVSATRELVPGYDCRAGLVYQSGATDVAPLVTLT